MSDQADREPSTEAGRELSRRLRVGQGLDYDRSILAIEREVHSDLARQVAIEKALDKVLDIWFAARFVDDDPEFRQAMVDLRAAAAIRSAAPVEPETVE